jgi:hypothetical protein
MKMNTTTEVKEFPTVIFGYQLPNAEPFILAKRVPTMKSESATVEKLWSLVRSYAENYDTETFGLNNPNLGRPFFGDKARSPWSFVDQNREEPFVFLGLLTDSADFLWGATIPTIRDDGSGFAERVAHALFGQEVAAKVERILVAGRTKNEIAMVSESRTVGL